MSLTISLLTTTLLCLAFASTRSFGVIGVFVLLNLFPSITLPVLLTAGVVFYLVKHN